MLHDITHCNAVDCPKKDKCYRFQAHLEAQADKLTYLTYLSNSKEDCWGMDMNDPKNIEWNQKYPDNPRKPFGTFWEIK